MAEPAITVQAYHTSQGSNYPVTRVVIHDEEYPVSSTSAEAIAQYFASSDAGGSAHYVEDSDGEQHCVSDDTIAWHAPPNQGSIGIEMDGYSRFVPSDWQQPGSQASIKRTAARTAELCDRFTVPKVWLTADDLRNGKHGITSHRNVSLAFGQSDHMDPGASFPITQFMGYVGGEPPIPNPNPSPPADPGKLRVDGDFGPATIAALQRAVGVADDGDFGPASKLATQHRVGAAEDGVFGRDSVVALQAHVGATQDGDWGPATTRSIQDHLNRAAF
ncbi:MAG: hypothetical protein NVSMB4_08190 [Acidimicrobiales bacterium]